MTAAPSLTWPGSRVLAGWWPALEPRRPRSLWLHHLLLHRVEATVAVSRSASLDALNRLLLEAVAADPRPMPALDPALLQRLLGDLKSAGLLSVSPDGWQLTEAGKDALAGRREACTQSERRAFHFAEGDSRHPGVRFLPLDNPPCTPAPQSPDWSFDVRALEECIAWGPERRQTLGFPPDVRGMVAAEANGWRRVIVDRPEQLTALFVLGEDGRLSGFAVQTSGWHLQADRAVLAMGEGWREALPELADEVDQAEWRAAWRAWGLPRGLPAGELEACILEREGVRLRVRAPRPMIERLRQTRSDALKGEAWLLAGNAERTRSAALVELREE